MRFHILVTSICMFDVIPPVLAIGSEYPDYIYVDLSWTNNNCTDCKYTTPQLRTIQYDHAHHLELPHDLEGRLLFRINNTEDNKSGSQAHIAGWIDINDGTEQGPIPKAHVWTVNRQLLDISTDHQAMDSTHEYSWATAVSNNGHVAGIHANRHTKTFNNNYMAAAWEAKGSSWNPAQSNPHLDLEKRYSMCNDTTGHLFQSAAFGIIDVETPYGTSYALTGGCDAGCNSCRPINRRYGTDGLEERYSLRTFRWYPNILQLPDVIASGPWEQHGTRVEHQFALGFLSDDQQAIGQGQILKGWLAQNESPCDDLAIPGPCHSPVALPTTFEFPNSHREHLQFQELIEEQPPGFNFYKYNYGILRDSFAHHVAGSTKDNVACNACNASGQQCDINDNQCDYCYFRAVHWANMNTPQQRAAMLPLAQDALGQDLQDWSYFGHGIGQHGDKLQIVGTRADITDGGGATNSALVWQMNDAHQWTTPLDLNDHLDAGHINIFGLDPRVNQHTLTLLSAHDVNDHGWIVGQALARYCDPHRDDPGDGDECVCGLDDANQEPWPTHRRAFLLIPVTDGCHPGESCRGDINDDGHVDSADAGLLFAAWGTDNSAADLNCDGIVNGADFGLLFTNWGLCRLHCPE